MNPTVRLNQAKRWGDVVSLQFASGVVYHVRSLLKPLAEGNDKVAKFRGVLQQFVTRLAANPEDETDLLQLSTDMLAAVPVLRSLVVASGDAKLAVAVDTFVAAGCCLAAKYASITDGESDLVHGESEVDLAEP